MPQYTDPSAIHNPTVGGIPPASWGSAVNSDLGFLNTWVGAFVTFDVRPSTVDLPDGLSTITYVPFSGPETHDSDGFHSSSSNPSRITVPSGLGGKYLVGAELLGNTPASNTYARNVQMFLRANGASEVLVKSEYVQPLSYSLGFNFNVVRPWFLSAGDYIEVGASQATLGQNSSLGLSFGTFWLRYMGA